MAEVREGHIGGMSEGGPTGVIIDNRTGIADSDVRDAVMAHWVETAGFQFGQPSTFQMFSNNQGSLLARTPFQVPKDIIEEIKLARSVAETDDDIQAVIGQTIAAAYRDGMQHQHPDEQTNALFNEWAKDINLDSLHKELMREYLVTGQVNTLALYTRRRYSFTPRGTESEVSAQLTVPLIGILPAENIRVVTTDLFGNGQLAFDVTDVNLRTWLDNYFNDRTTEAQRFQMRSENPVVAAVFTGRVEMPWNDPDLTIAGKTLYTLNQSMVKRTTMPKGASPYPRPLLTSNFALLEAKRLLNVMDFALLQGGTNYIVVAKQGSDKLPAQQGEIDNLVGQVRSASRSGVLVGDHRLDIEIIVPELTELLNPAKRKLIGRKLAMAIWRIPEQVTNDGGGEGMKSEMDLASNTVTGDRRDIKRHVEGQVYDQIVKRNPSRFRKGAPSLWYQRVVLAGQKDFYDAVLKTRDRGDIPRKWSVEMLGFDFEAGVAQRKREKAEGLDELMTAGDVPFSSPQAGPQDNGPGRPPGTSPNNGRNGGSPPAPQGRNRRTVIRTPGETIKAEWDEAAQRTVWFGELTAAILEEYPDHEVGRVTSLERDAVDRNEIFQRGPVAVIPVNSSYDVEEIRAIRLEPGLSMVVGQRAEDGAIVARALCFREPQWTVEQAEEIVRRWGYEPVRPEEAQEDPEDETAAAVAAPEEAMAVRVAEIFAETLKAMPQPTINVTLPGQKPMKLVRDPKTGAVIGTEPAE